ncbi:9266_t:CDS:2 [Paraglomus brasilianum]|uniref:9266_t:CDS:1 n=1 Tax=Paraglomus brasilianum TaxID=144538 RepID=A0A9N9GCM5_9GLOM|nr:9266_t:CDS:2 [Paraglomus brasilianum]
MDNKCNIEEELQYGAKIISELNACNKTLRDNQLKQNKKWDRERKQWDRERNKWDQKLDISLAESKAKYATKLEEIKSLRNEMKLLKGKLDLSQKDSSNKGSEIESLKSEIVELALKISELERLKSEGISGSIIGGDVEAVQQGQSPIVFTIKNTQSEELDAPTVNSVVSPQTENVPEFSLRPFLVVRPKKTSSELIESSTTTQPDKSSTSSSPTTQSRTATVPLPNSTRKNSTCSTVTEKNSEKKSSIDSSAVRLQNIKEIESDSRTSIGGIETIPIAASYLGLLFTFLILLLIAIILFTVLKPTWAVRLENRNNRNLGTLHPPAKENIHSQKKTAYHDWNSNVVIPPNHRQTPM